MKLLQSPPGGETVERFPCFGGECAVLVEGPGPAGSAAEATARARRRLEAWHRQFSRFETSSELSILNHDPRQTVPVSAMMQRFVEAAITGAAATGGLVDPTLVTELEEAGYAGQLGSEPVPLRDALRLAGPRRPARPHAQGRWRALQVDRRAGTVTRPPGVALDSGGIAKGLFVDVLASVLGLHPSFAVEAAGDVRFGGSAGVMRPLRVASPFDGGILHVFELVSGAAATSGIGRRSWRDARGRPAHHLLDPATGRPAFTGVAQATALAPTGAHAEALAKAALLAGPEGAAGWLPHGGLIVYDSGAFDLVAAWQSELAR